MDYFDYKNDTLHAEDVALGDIAASHGTPCFVYSRRAIETAWRSFDDAFASHPHLVCYAVKANSSLAVLNIMARLGSGFDVVSVGELERVVTAGGDPTKTVFSGVGKRRDEIARALELGVQSINIESPAELTRVIEVAKAHECIAPIGVRVNPDVDAGTHPYIATGLADNKFGVSMDDAPGVYAAAADSPYTHVHAIAFHIGSQLTSVSPFADAVERILVMVDTLSADGIDIELLDLGGGLGVRYDSEAPPSAAHYADAVLDVLKRHHCKLPISLEPGRSIVANAGILLTRVEFLKPGSAKNFAIVDAAMNDLIRPSLYQAWQAIDPVDRSTSNRRESRVWDIVGPVCESGDWLARARELALAEGDLMAIRSSGAYGAVMSSNYNSRPRAPEILVDGDTSHVIRERESVRDLFALEQLLPD